MSLKFHIERKHGSDAIMIYTSAGKVFLDAEDVKKLWEWLKENGGMP
jgi:Holliday junction resolvase